MLGWLHMDETKEMHACLCINQIILYIQILLGVLVISAVRYLKLEPR